jgi:hypothetical protein
VLYLPFSIALPPRRLDNGMYPLSTL